MSLRLTKPGLAFAMALVLFCCLPKSRQKRVHGPSSVVAAKVKKSTPKPPRKKRKRLTHKQKVERKTKRSRRIAKRYLGVSYRWGGSSPQSGFDCSGLLKYVYGRVGIRLPRFTAGQFTAAIASGPPTSTAAISSSSIGSATSACTSAAAR